MNVHTHKDCKAEIERLERVNAKLVETVRSVLDRAMKEEPAISKKASAMIFRVECIQALEAALAEAEGGAS